LENDIQLLKDFLHYDDNSFFQYDASKQWFYLRSNITKNKSFQLYRLCC